MTESDHHYLPNRNRPVHQPAADRGNRSVIVFVTVCTKNRSPRLASPEMHQSLLQAWNGARNWLVGRYVILPDHIHLFCAPGVYPPAPLLNWVRYWKSQVAKQTGNGSEMLWQKNFWDTQLRQSDSYQARWEYVKGNPVRHNLVPITEEWSYQGELNVLPWNN